MYSIHIVTAHTTVNFAAEELKKYLRMMMPDAGEITVDYDAKAEDGYRLGLMQDFGLDVSEAPDVELDDIIHIDTDDKGGIIAGDNYRSVLLAVYRFLRFNGCRWLFPGIDGEFIPIQTVKGVKYHKMADNRYRGQCNEGAEYQPNMMEVIDFTPKIGMNIFMQEFLIPGYYHSYYDHTRNESNREPEPVTDETLLQWKRQCEAEITKRGLEYHDIGHGWTTESFGIDTMEFDRKGSTEIPAGNEKYLALLNGKRDINGRPYDTNFCMSTPEARHIVADAVVKYAKNAGNVDYLHVWLSDGLNNHCECEECQKMIPSDWYVVLANDIDDALTKAKLDTRIVICCYNDTVWPPESQTINNPDRFSLLLGPVYRSYLKPPTTPSAPEIAITPYVRNNNGQLRSVDEYIAYAREWKRRCKIPVLVYEYHFWVFQCFYPGCLHLAKLIHGDIRGYRSNNLSGIIEDGSQRSFFPNGFSFYVYGETLFDSNVEFDALVEDYFSHAYGEDWKVVVSFLEELESKFSYEYLLGRGGSEHIYGRAGRYYNPTLAKDLREVPDLVKNFQPFIESHKNMPYRAQTVAVRLFSKYLEYITGFANIMTLKCLGADEEALEAKEKFFAEFGKYEVEIERYYDQCIFAHACNTLVKLRGLDLSKKD